MQNNDCDNPIIIETNNLQTLYYYPLNGMVSLTSEQPAILPVSLKETFSSVKIKNLAIRLTGECNLACTYCFNQFHGNKDVIDEVVLCKSINDYANQLSVDDDLNIIITGGEPLIYKERIFYIFNQISSISNKRKCLSNFLIYTNATIIDEDYLSLFSKHNVTLAISVDGIKAKHDKHRISKNSKSSYMMMVSGISKLINYGVNLEARSVIQSDETDILEIINNNLSLGFTTMQLIPVYGEKVAKIGNEKTYKSWIAAMDIYIKLLKKGVCIIIEPFFSMFRKLVYPLKFYTSYRPCDSGYGTISICDDSFYYLCTHFSGAVSARLSGYYEGIPKSTQIDRIIQQTIYSEDCNNCWALRVCGGSCYHNNYLNKLRGASDNQTNNCIYWKSMIKHLISIYANEIINDPIILQFLGDYQVKLPKEFINYYISVINKLQSEDI